MIRRNQMLVGMFVLQLVLAVFVMTRSSGGVNLEQAAVLPGFDATTVTRLQIFEAGAPKGLDLVKQGTAWVLASHWDYPVDATKIDAALAPLAKSMAGEPITTSPAKHKQQKVADADFEKKLVISAGGKDLTLFVGVTRSRRTAVRLAGDDRVLGASGIPTGALTATARDWVAPSYSDIPRDDLDKIEIVRGTTKIGLDRTAAGGSGSAVERTWRVMLDGAPLVLATGETLETFAIETIVSDVASITAEPADPKRAITPAATITVTRKSGPSVVFDVVETGPTYWVKQRGVERATSLDKTRLESVMAADRTKLVRKPDGGPKTTDPGGPTGLPGTIVPAPEFE